MKIARPPLLLFVASTSVMAWPLKTSAADAEFEVPIGQRQLFLDDAGLERTDGIRRVVHPPKRHGDNPLLRPDTSWERGCQVYGTAYYDETAQRFKLWYLTGPKDRGLKPLKLDGYERAPHTTMAAYAESKDGVHWVKPKLVILPYDGDKQNNLLGIGRYNCEGISRSSCLTPPPGL